MVKNPPANEGSTGDTGSIPGAGRFPEEEMATYSGVPAWRIPWTEEPGHGVAKESDVTQRLNSSRSIITLQCCAGFCLRTM